MRCVPSRTDLNSSKKTQPSHAFLHSGEELPQWHCTGSIQNCFHVPNELYFRLTNRAHFNSSCGKHSHSVRTKPQLSSEIACVLLILPDLQSTIVRLLRRLLLIRRGKFLRSAVTALYGYCDHQFPDNLTY